MRIIVVGAEGDIGKVVCEKLGNRHDIIRAGRNKGDVLVDMVDPMSVVDMYSKVRTVEAVIVTAGEVHFGELQEFDHQKFMFGIQNKVMGQINLVMAGMSRIAKGGSFTLTSGILNRDPIRTGVGAATANGALDSFVVAAAIEMTRGQRINVVSPGLLEVSADRYGELFAGHEPVSSKRVGLAYAKCVEGAITGQVVTVD